MNTAHLSFECVVLLSRKIAVVTGGKYREKDEEELESFLYAIAKGNVFELPDYFWHLPVAVQNDTIDFYQMFARIWSSHPEWLIISATSRSDYPLLTQNCTEFYSAGIAQVAWDSELLDYARSWREAEPDNEDARYYEYAQRVYCGEGKPAGRTL